MLEPRIDCRPPLIRPRQVLTLPRPTQYPSNPPRPRRPQISKPCRFRLQRAASEHAGASRSAHVPDAR